MITYVDEKSGFATKSEEEAQKYMKEKEIIYLEIYEDDLWTGQVLAKKKEGAITLKKGEGVAFLKDRTMIIVKK